MKILGAGSRSERNSLSRSGQRTSVTSEATQSTASRYVDKRSARRTDSSDRVGSSRTRRTDTLTSARTVRSPDTRNSITDDAAIITANELGTRDSGIRRSRRTENETTVVINNNNNVVVQGNVTETYHRPQIGTRHLTHEISHYRHRPRWKSHGGIYFSFTWSNRSCGRVAYLPYRYHHSWCDYPVSYAPYYGLSFYYPRYHRRFIYVSIGGYWPSWYRYRRYYWYGCHPYYWYGPTIIREPYQNVTYNTYNYYDTDGQASGYSSSTLYNTLGETRSEEVLDEPAYQTPADLCFENGVELFTNGNYEDAVRQFREAVLLAPDDIVLPFTYSQALFANGQYALAVNVLREAMNKIPEDELTIYYPRGLYDKETRLEEQIAQLENAIAREPFDADYQLLLGYQHLGMGNLDKARSPLNIASGSPANRNAANKLLELTAQLEAEKIKSE